MKLAIIAGLLMGLAAAALEWFGNPVNMGICVVCFERDIAGALGLHDAAPIHWALAGGLLIGVLAQRTRFCTVGAIRNVLFGGPTRLLFALAAFVVAGLALKLALGRAKPGFAGQFLAHSDILWNFLGMVLAGLAFTLAGGCPGRQLVLAGILFCVAAGLLLHRPRAA